MNKIVIILIAIIAIIALAGLGILYSRNAEEKATQEAEEVVIGMPMLLDASALVYIASDRGYFADNGLNVTINVYDAGVYAVEDMLNDRNDIAIATEFVMADKLLDQEELSSVATTSKYEIHYLIGRQDRGIETQSDLKGKRIGYASGTSGEFYLTRYLALHGINMTDVTLVHVPPGNYTEAIANGSVDAVLAWDPHVDAIRKRLGSGAVVWPAQSGQLGYWNVLVRDGWAEQHPETVARFLRSIDQAVDYVIYHPADAKAILQKGTDFDDAYIDTVWNSTHYSLSLDASLITAMEDEARWMINNNLTEVKTVPDFPKNFYLDGLRSIKPGSVNIIR